MCALSVKCTAAYREIAKFLRIVIAAAYTLAYIAYILEIGFFAGQKRECGTGIYPYYIAVVMGAEVKGLSEIVRARGIGRNDYQSQSETAHQLFHVACGKKVLAYKYGYSAYALIVKNIHDIVCGYGFKLRTAVSHYPVRILFALPAYHISVTVDNGGGIEFFAVERGKYR